MSYRLNQQMGSGRYYDRANEFGGHGGDLLYRGAPRDQRRTQEYLDYCARVNECLAIMHAEGAEITSESVRSRMAGGDFEQLHQLDCCCPTCILRAVAAEM